MTGRTTRTSNPSPSEGPGAAAKWTQQPDTTSAGVDVDFTKDLPPTWPTTICADDFECRETGPITGITLWASWYHDVLSGGSAENATFTLSIRQDIPADRSPTGYSMPGKVLWRKTFNRGQFTVEPVQTYAESYYSPANITFEQNTRAMLYKYTFKIDAAEAFQQTGTAKSPVVYWLTVQSRLIHSPGSVATRLGWKTSTSHWNDAAVWVKAEEPYDGTWNKLAYPKGHSLSGRPIDLAFAIETEQAGAGTTFRRIVADDWRCATAQPVTGIAWWGSYIGYNYPPAQCQQATPPRQPDSFLLSLWSDVPDPDPSNTRDFGHPGRKLWEYKADTFDEVMVGFDNNPYPTVRAEHRAGVPLHGPPARGQVVPPGRREQRALAERRGGLQGRQEHRLSVGLDEPCVRRVGPEPRAAGPLEARRGPGHDRGRQLRQRQQRHVLGNPVWRPAGGWLAGALEFDGRGDYIKVEKPKGFNFAPSSFSVSTWIYPKETRGRWHAIMEYDRNSLNGNRFGLWLDVEGRFHFRVGQNTWQSPDALAPNQWYHLTAVYDAGCQGR